LQTLLLAIYTRELLVRLQHGPSLVVVERKGPEQVRQAVMGIEL
jgi:hypothetical protein